MEWDCSIAVEVHGSASTVGISVMVMVAVDVSRGRDGVLEWGSKKLERGRGPVWTCVDLCGLVDQVGHHPPASAPAVSPNNTSLSVLRALSSSYTWLHKM